MLTDATDVELPGVLPVVLRRAYASGYQTGRLFGPPAADTGVPPPAGPAWQNFLVRFEDAYRAELAEFARVARGEVESPCTGRDGVEALRTALAATRSRKEHRPVRVEEIA